MFNNSEKVPFWFMRQAGRYMPEYHQVFNKGKNFLDVCYNPELAFEITLQPIKKFDMSAAIMFSDILLLPHALGCNVNFIKNVGPIIEPLTTELNFIDYQKLEEKLQPIFKLLRKLRKNLTAEKDLIGFAGSPFTVLAYLIEGGSSKTFSKVKEIAYKNEEKFAFFINRITEATTFYLNKQIENGANIVQLFDSWSGILSAEEFNRWVIKPTQKIVSNLIGAKVIGFPKGAGCLYIDYVKQTGVDAVSVDYSVPLEWIRDNLQPLTIVQGNLDPFLLTYNKERALKQAENIFSVLGNNHFIFNLGHGINKETPVEHVEALVEKIKCWKRI